MTGSKKWSPPWQNPKEALLPRGPRRVQCRKTQGVFPSCPWASGGKSGWPMGERRFLLWHLWLPLALLTGLLIVFETTDLDLRLSDPFFDFEKGLFFWRDTWWAKRLLHSGGKIFVGGIWLCLLFLWIYQMLRGNSTKLRSWRVALVFLMISMALGPITLAGIKLLVNRPYPEHIKRYGGSLEYNRLFQSPPPTGKHYKGFPAGHASAGYGLLGLYFVLRETRPRLGGWGLIFGLGLGSLFGFAQHVRGMHYFSHNLWSAAICWFEALFLYLVFFRGRLQTIRAQDPPGS